MSLALYIIVFLAPVALAAKNVTIDQQLLLQLFGNSNGVYPYPSLFSQAEPVTPRNDTLLDLDYWDSLDEFSPSSAEYDKFDWTLTKRVASVSDENFLLSPLGLKLALAILTEAATGTTQSELISVLGFDLDRTVVRRKFATIVESLQAKSSQYILNVGSRIYVGETATPRQRFAAIAQQFYNTELKKVDFSNPPKAASEINGWIANLTEGRIPNLVDEDDVTNVVVMILNTLYFKGSWRHQFNPNETREAPFYISPKLNKSVQYMHVIENFYCTESAKFDAKILRMPYLGNKFAMYIIVPNSLMGLPRILNQISELRAEMYYLQEHSVDVLIPKFKFDYTSLLDGILRELGVRQAFEDTASFPGIARGQSLTQRLKVTKVLQRSGIEVNELGSIAYSATEISLVNKFGEDNNTSYEVIANKPFLFFIQDESTKQLLFTGRVSDPSMADGALKTQIKA